jgi:serine/threonine protein kinase
MLAITPGTSINNRYEIQKILGQGSFGRTYLASDTQRFGDLCVLKEFLPSNRAEYAIQKSRELFEREARVLYQINHPQIPKFLAWFTEQERLFLVQEYINGQTYSHLLHERISQQGQAFSETEVIQWLKDLLSVLDYLHDIQIIHRDISPENVMFSHDQSKPILIDFGLVKETITQIWSVDPDSVQEYTQASIIGKYGYAPPEQIRLGQCFPSSDLYALAVCAVVLLTGKNPKLLMDQSLEWQWHSYVNISTDLTEILDKMLADKPRHRYQSAQEILAELQLVIPLKQESVSLPRKKLQINIDHSRREREVAEILESDEFKILEQQAYKFRKPNQISEDFQEEDLFWQSTTASELISNQTIEPMTVVPEAELQPIPINPEFLKNCQQELSRCIGPMANSLLEDTLTQFPHITPEQLVETLAKEIPNLQRAQVFRNSIKIPSTQPELQAQEEEVTAQPTQINPDFLEHCQQELSRCIGPMASFIIEDTLAQFPQMTLEQLVEALMAEIPNPQRAKDFRTRLKM